MKQSWGPGLLILGAVVLMKGEHPCVCVGRGVVQWVFRGHPLPRPPHILVRVREHASGVDRLSVVM